MFLLAARPICSSLPALDTRDWRWDLPVSCCSVWPSLGCLGSVVSWIRRNTHTSGYEHWSSPLLSWSKLPRHSNTYWMAVKQQIGRLYKLNLSVGRREARLFLSNPPLICHQAYVWYASWGDFDLHDPDIAYSTVSICRVLAASCGNHLHILPTKVSASHRTSTVPCGHIHSPAWPTLAAETSQGKRWWISTSFRSSSASHGIGTSAAAWKTLATVFLETWSMSAIFRWLKPCERNSRICFPLDIYWPPFWYCGLSAFLILIPARGGSL